jgi:hypothetical protein
MINHIQNLTLDGNFRAKAHRVLEEMRSAGYAAAPYSSLRSKAEQAEKVKRGVSKTNRSGHVAGRDGKARALDIADAEAFPGPWDAPRVFWILLGRLALTKNLGWGGLFGLPLSTKIKFVKFLLEPSTKDKPFRPENWQGKIGWDPAHIEQKPGWLDQIIRRL